MSDRIRSVAALAALLLLAYGCGGDAGEAGRLSGTVSIDGSSTVFPITEAMAEEFQLANAGTRVTVGVSGTGGGFAKFCNGETDISDASRPIKGIEAEECAEQGVDYVEVPVAYDGITVAVNPQNDWAQCVTVEELRQIWQPGSTVDNWQNVRDSWPDREMALFGPGTDSGTFDYFTEAIMGEEDASRADYSASEDDNVTLMGLSNNVGAMGYFGFAYYHENQQQVKALGVDDGTGCVRPSMESIESGEYAPLSRPLYIYVREEALERPVVKAFVEFYLGNGRELVPEVGYVPLAATRYDSLQATLPLGDGAAGDTTG